MESKLIFSRLPYEAAPDELGPFHRLQCSHINDQMCATGRIGGGRSYGSGFRRVHAYVGPLPDADDGLEFWTKVPPDQGTPPHLAYWTEGAEGVSTLAVSENQEIVAIVATVVKRVDSHAHCRCKP